MDSNLSDQQKAALNRMLAVAIGAKRKCPKHGYKCNEISGGVHICFHSRNELPFENLPNYCSSLDACAEVEAGLTDEQRFTCSMRLVEVTGMDPEGWMHQEMHKVFMAKPWQRVIALLRTLGRGAEVDRILNSTE